jgi:hypothetical protein
MKSRGESQRPEQSRQGMALRVALFLFCPALSVCQPQAHSILCREGNGTFSATLENDVSVHVGAAREQGLSRRACAAKLGWRQQELLVEADAAQIDLDAFGVDFGTGALAAAFQIKKSDTDCCMEYRIYSLEKTFRSLRTITGAGFFSASDVDLDGRIEIWASDADAADGFESLTLSEIEFPPIIVFRLAHDQLLDVSAEFQRYFDQEIASIEQEILPLDLEDFKNSDGRLAGVVTPATAERRHRLRVMKTRALEVVWAYLYSGREEKAWHSLAEMWPPADLDRVREALLKARARGIHREADHTISGPAPGKRKQVRIVDIDDASATGLRSRVTPPKAIQLDLQPIVGGPQPMPPGRMVLDLVIDAAGKVRSADSAGTAHYPSEWIAMAMAWKFIPAFVNGRAVASRLRIDVSPKQ